MIKFEFATGEIGSEKQAIITAGFSRHTHQHSAPPFAKERLNWSAYNEHAALVGVVTAGLLWDWMEIDELWVDESCRDQGVGTTLMQLAEEYAKSLSLTGLWLWTQSWQAAPFYQRLGYEEFARFDDCPKGYFRLGFRKYLSRL